MQRQSTLHHCSPALFSPPSSSPPPCSCSSQVGDRPARPRQLVGEPLHREKPQKAEGNAQKWPNKAGCRQHLPTGRRMWGQRCIGRIVEEVQQRCDSLPPPPPPRQIVIELHTPYMVYYIRCLFWARYYILLFHVSFYAMKGRHIIEVIRRLHFSCLVRACDRPEGAALASSLLY